VVAGTQFTSADTTTKKTLATAGANGTRIDGILVSSNDTAAVNLQFYVNDGSTDFYLGVVAIPAGSGYTTIARVDAIATLAPANVRALILKGTYVLKAAALATMTAAKVLDCLVCGGEY
jgi:hypothetical protein